MPTIGAAAAGAAAGYLMGQHDHAGQSSHRGGGYPSKPASYYGGPLRPGKAPGASTAAIAGSAFGYSSSDQLPARGRPYSVSPVPAASLALKHRPRGPMRKFLDFWKDSQAVGQYEEYSEYVGVCKGCFDPGSTSRDAPRKHHHGRRRSWDRRSTGSRVDKESRYYSSDASSGRSRKNRSWIAAGLAGYGLTKVGKSLFGQDNDSWDAYSARSGRASAAHRSTARESGDGFASGGEIFLGRTDRSSGSSSRSSSSSGHGAGADVSSTSKTTGVRRKGHKRRKGKRSSTSTTVVVEKSRRRSRSDSSSSDRMRGAVTGGLAASIASGALSHRRRRSRSRSGPKTSSAARSPSRRTVVTFAPDLVGSESLDRAAAGRISPSTGLPAAARGSRSERLALAAHAQPGSRIAGHVRKPVRKGSRRAAKPSSSSSSSSSELSSATSSADSALAFGGGVSRRGSRDSLTSKRAARGQGDMALLGLGAAAAALFATNQAAKSRNGKRAPGSMVEGGFGLPIPGLGKSSASAYRRAAPSHPTGPDDEGWESASDDEDSSSGHSSLAFGSYVGGEATGRRKNHGSSSSSDAASGTDKWNWRWGRKPAEPRKERIQPAQMDPASLPLDETAAAGNGQSVGHGLAASAFPHARDPSPARGYSREPSLQEVYPMPTSDPTRFDVEPYEAVVPLPSQLVRDVRPVPVPLQHPQPHVPVPSAVYSRAAPVEPSFTAPAELPRLSGPPAHPISSDVGSGERIPASSHRAPTLRSEPTARSGVVAGTAHAADDVAAQRRSEQANRREAARRERAKRREAEERAASEREQARARRESRRSQQQAPQIVEREDPGPGQAVSTPGPGFAAVAGFAAAAAGAATAIAAMGSSSAADAEQRTPAMHPEASLDSELVSQGRRGAEPHAEGIHPRPEEPSSRNGADIEDYDYEETPSVLDKYKEADLPMASYMDISGIIAQSPTRSAPVNDEQDPHHVPEIVTIAPPDAGGSSAHDRSYGFAAENYDRPSFPFPWAIPRLNLINPTPPRSKFGSISSVRSGSSSRAPPAEDATATAPAAEPVSSAEAVATVVQDRSEPVDSVVAAGARADDRERSRLPDGQQQVPGPDASALVQAQDVGWAVMSMEDKADYSTPVRAATQPKERDVSDQGQAIVASGDDLERSSWPEPSRQGRDHRDPPELSQAEQQDEDWRSASNWPRVPGGFIDDTEFAATLAAGLEDTGFDPSIVLDDPSFGRRMTPSRSGSNIVMTSVVPTTPLPEHVEGQRSSSGSPERSQVPTNAMDMSGQSVGAPLALKRKSSSGSNDTEKPRTALDSINDLFTIPIRSRRRRKKQQGDDQISGSDSASAESSRAAPAVDSHPESDDQGKPGVAATIVTVEPPTETPKAGLDRIHASTHSGLSGQRSLDLEANEPLSPPVAGPEQSDMTAAHLRGSEEGNFQLDDAAPSAMSNLTLASTTAFSTNRSPEDTAARPVSQGSQSHNTREAESSEPPVREASFDDFAVPKKKGKKAKGQSAAVKALQATLPPVAASPTTEQTAGKRDAPEGEPAREAEWDGSFVESSRKKKGKQKRDRRSGKGIDKEFHDAAETPSAEPALDLSASKDQEGSRDAQVSVHQDGEADHPRRVPLESIRDGSGSTAHSPPNDEAAALKPIGTLAGGSEPDPQTADQPADAKALEADAQRDVQRDAPDEYFPMPKRKEKKKKGRRGVLSMETPSEEPTIPTVGDHEGAADIAVGDSGRFNDTISRRATTDSADIIPSTRGVQDPEMELRHTQEHQPADPEVQPSQNTELGDDDDDDMALVDFKKVQKNGSRRSVERGPEPDPGPVASFDATQDDFSMPKKKGKKGKGRRADFSWHDDDLETTAPADGSANGTNGAAADETPRFEDKKSKRKDKKKNNKSSKAATDSGRVTQSQKVKPSKSPSDLGDAVTAAAAPDLGAAVSRGTEQQSREGSVLFEAGPPSTDWAYLADAARTQPSGPEPASVAVDASQPGPASTTGTAPALVPDSSSFPPEDLSKSLQQNPASPSPETDDLPPVPDSRPTSPVAARVFPVLPAGPLSLVPEDSPSLPTSPAEPRIDRNSLDNVPPLQRSPSTTSPRSATAPRSRPASPIERDDARNATPVPAGPSPEVSDNLPPLPGSRSTSPLMVGSITDLPSLPHSRTPSPALGPLPTSQESPIVLSPIFDESEHRFEGFASPSQGPRCQEVEISSDGPKSALGPDPEEALTSWPESPYTTHPQYLPDLPPAQAEDLPPLPTSRPTSPVEIGSATDLPALPDSPQMPAIDELQPQDETPTAVSVNRSVPRDVTPPSVAVPIQDADDRPPISRPRESVSAAAETFEDSTSVGRSPPAGPSPSSSNDDLGISSSVVAGSLEPSSTIVDQIATRQSSDPSRSATTTTSSYSGGVDDLPPLPSSPAASSSEYRAVDDGPPLLERPPVADDHGFPPLPHSRPTSPTQVGSALDLPRLPDSPSGNEIGSPHSCRSPTKSPAPEATLDDLPTLQESNERIEDDQWLPVQVSEQTPPASSDSAPDPPGTFTVAEINDLPSLPPSRATTPENVPGSLGHLFKAETGNLSSSFQPQPRSLPLPEAINNLPVPLSSLVVSAQDELPALPERSPAPSIDSPTVDNLPILPGGFPAAIASEAPGPEPELPGVAATDSLATARGSFVVAEKRDLAGSSPTLPSTPPRADRVPLPPESSPLEHEDDVRGSPRSSAETAVGPGPAASEDRPSQPRGLPEDGVVAAGLPLAGPRSISPIHCGSAQGLPTLLARRISSALNNEKANDRPDPEANNDPGRTEVVPEAASGRNDAKELSASEQANSDDTAGKDAAKAVISPQERQGPTPFEAWHSFSQPRSKSVGAVTVAREISPRSATSATADSGARPFSPKRASEAFLVSPGKHSSPTAIPIHFRRPRALPGHQRTSWTGPAIVQEGGSSPPVPRTRHFKAGSTDFKPLYLVERHNVRQMKDPEEEAFPPLPPSRSSMAGSAAHSEDEADASADKDVEGQVAGSSVAPLRITTQIDQDNAEWLGSGEPTPRGFTFDQTAMMSAPDHETSMRPSDDMFGDAGPRSPAAIERTFSSGVPLPSGVAPSLQDVSSIQPPPEQIALPELSDDDLALSEPVAPRLTVTEPEPPATLVTGTLPPTHVEPDPPSKSAVEPVADDEGLWGPVSKKKGKGKKQKGKNKEKVAQDYQGSVDGTPKDRSQQPLTEVPTPSFETPLETPLVEPDDFAISTSKKKKGKQAKRAKSAKQQVTQTSAALADEELVRVSEEPLHVATSAEPPVETTDRSAISSPGLERQEAQELKASRSQEDKLAQSFIDLASDENSAAQNALAETPADAAPLETPAEKVDNPNDFLGFATRKKKGKKGKAFFADIDQDKSIGVPSQKFSEDVAKEAPFAPTLAPASTPAETPVGDADEFFVTSSKKKGKKGKKNKTTQLQVVDTAAAPISEPPDAVESVPSTEAFSSPPPPTDEAAQETAAPGPSALTTIVETPVEDADPFETTSRKKGKKSKKGKAGKIEPLAKEASASSTDVAVPAAAAGTSSKLQQDAEDYRGLVAQPEVNPADDAEEDGGRNMSDLQAPNDNVEATDDGSDGRGVELTDAQAAELQVLEAALNIPLLAPEDSDMDTSGDAPLHEPVTFEKENLPAAVAREAEVTQTPAEQDTIDSAAPKVEKEADFATEGSATETKGNKDEKDKNGGKRTVDDIGLEDAPSAATSTVITPVEADAAIRPVAIAEGSKAEEATLDPEDKSNKEEAQTSLGDATAMTEEQIVPDDFWAITVKKGKKKGKKATAKGTKPEDNIPPSALASVVVAGADSAAQEGPIEEGSKVEDSRRSLGDAMDREKSTASLDTKYITAEQEAAPEELWAPTSKRGKKKGKEASFKAAELEDTVVSPASAVVTPTGEDSASQDTSIKEGSRVDATNREEVTPSLDSTAFAPPEEPAPEELWASTSKKGKKKGKGKKSASKAIEPDKTADPPALTAVATTGAGSAAQDIPTIEESKVDEATSSPVDAMKKEESTPSLDAPTTAAVEEPAPEEIWASTSKKGKKKGKKTASKAIELKDTITPPVSTATATAEEGSTSQDIPTNEESKVDEVTSSVKKNEEATPRFDAPTDAATEEPPSKESWASTSKKGKRKGKQGRVKQNFSDRNAPRSEPVDVATVDQAIEPDAHDVTIVSKDIEDVQAPAALPISTLLDVDGRDLVETPPTVDRQLEIDHTDETHPEHDHHPAFDIRSSLQDMEPKLEPSRLQDRSDETVPRIRDSGVLVSDSPLVSSHSPAPGSVRDSGFQDALAGDLSSPRPAPLSMIALPDKEPERERVVAPAASPVEVPASPPPDLAAGTGFEGAQSAEAQAPLAISPAATPTGDEVEAILEQDHPANDDHDLLRDNQDPRLEDAVAPIVETGKRIEGDGRKETSPQSSVDGLPPPSPVESTSKDRESVLFASPPPASTKSAQSPRSPLEEARARAEPRRPNDSSAPESSRNVAEEETPLALGAVGRGSPPQPTSHSFAQEESTSLADDDQLRHRSIFGGPVGVNSDADTHEDSRIQPPSEPRQALDPIAEDVSDDGPLPKPAPSTPKRRGKAYRSLSPPESALTPERSKPLNEPSSKALSSPANSDHGEVNAAGEFLSTDALISRLSWPAVDDDAETVDLDRAKSRGSQRPSSSTGAARPRRLSHNAPATPDPMRPHRRDVRSPSGNSVGSNLSLPLAVATRLNSPDSVDSRHSAGRLSHLSGGTGTGTPPLRRAGRRFSGDLRAASKREASRLAGKDEADRPFSPTLDLHPPVPQTASSPADDVAEDSSRSLDMAATVYQGWGDVPRPALSPTRPASVRRRQSLQIIDLEGRLEQLAAENRQLQAARVEAERNLADALDGHSRNNETLSEAVRVRDVRLAEREVEVGQLQEMLAGLRLDIGRLREMNEELSTTNATHGDRYGSLQAEHLDAQRRWDQSRRELDEVRRQNEELSGSVEAMVRQEMAEALEEQNVEMDRLRAELQAAREEVRTLQREILEAKSNEADSFLVVRDEDHFEAACQQLCQHAQQWVLRFSKFSDMHGCRLVEELRDEKIMDRLENSVLDGSDVDVYLNDRVKRRDVFMSMVMTMIWDFIFTRYLFGMDRDQRQKLKSVEKLLAEVGPAAAVHQWRATTLTLLSRRPNFASQRSQDSEAVVQEIYKSLAAILPPPANREQQLVDSLRNVVHVAADLSIEMRTQRAEYMMLPPLQPDYDGNGELVRKVYFNAALMNDRSGGGGGGNDAGASRSNEELEARQAVVRIVLFPLVVRRGDDHDEGDEEIVVCPAQVLVAPPSRSSSPLRTSRSPAASSLAYEMHASSSGGRVAGAGPPEGKRVVRVVSGDRMSIDQTSQSQLGGVPRQHHGEMPSSYDMGNVF